MKQGPIMKTCALMRELSPGESFYVEAEPKRVTHYATIWKVKVQTMVCLVVDNPTGDPIARRATKVTVL